MTETLADLVILAMEAQGATSGRDLGDIAKRRGLALPHTQINKMRMGRYQSTPKRQTLEAIATLAQVTTQRALDAAGVPQPGPPFARELPPDVDRLEPYQRKAVIAVVRAFLTDLKRQGPGDQDHGSDSPS